VLKVHHQKVISLSAVGWIIRVNGFKNIVVMPLFKEKRSVYYLHVYRRNIAAVSVIHGVIPGECVRGVRQVILKCKIDHLVISQWPLRREYLVVGAVISPVLGEISLVNLPVPGGVAFADEVAVGITLQSCGDCGVHFTFRMKAAIGVNLILRDRIAHADPESQKGQFVQG
jgi:hypothetical protein